jgi:hypothetical protein
MDAIHHRRRHHTKGIPRGHRNAYEIQDVELQAMHKKDATRSALAASMPF